MITVINTISVLLKCAKNILMYTLESFPQAYFEKNMNKISTMHFCVHKHQNKKVKQNNIPCLVAYYMPSL